MKKLVFMAVVILTVTSCNKTKNTADAKDATGDTINPITNQKELVNFVSKRDLYSGAGCGNHLVSICKTGFSADPAEAETLYDKFRLDNKDYLSALSIGAKNCGEGDYSYFNIIKYIAKEKDYSKIKFSKWLNQYGKAICFKDMYPLIECVHKIDDPKIIELLNAVKEGETPLTLKFSKIKSDIRVKGGDYDKDHYENYLNFVFDWGNKVTFNLSQTYKATGDYYSIPFIRSILENNSLQLSAGMDTELEFFQVPLFTEADQVIMGIKLDNGKYNYYDFSQIPPIYGGMSTYYNFSPL